MCQADNTASPHLSQRENPERELQVREHFVTTNPCTKCQPLGAIFAFKGLKGCLPMIHGSQGCATYMRLHIAHHFREPIDVASSSLSEHSAVYGGQESLLRGIDNAESVYKPESIGIASSCLAETIGEDLTRYASEVEASGKNNVIFAATPSFMGCHIEGFNKTVLAVLKKFATRPIADDELNHSASIGVVQDAPTPFSSIGVVLGTIISPHEIRYLKRFVGQFSPNSDGRSSKQTADSIIFPDYSDSLQSPFPGASDNDLFNEFAGVDVLELGTPSTSISRLPAAKNVYLLGAQFDNQTEVAAFLDGVAPGRVIQLDPPFGLASTDEFVSSLASINGAKVPREMIFERGRLLDAMIDSHKELYNKRVIIYGDPDLAYGLTRICFENGMFPVIIATGSKTRKFKERVESLLTEHHEPIKPTDAERTRPIVLIDADHQQINHYAKSLEPDLILANSHARYISKNLSIPLIEVGFPTYDIFGGEHILTLGYEGAMELIFRMVNSLRENKRARCDNEQ